MSISRTKNMSLSIPTTKPSQIRSLTQKFKLISTPLLKWCLFDTHPERNSLSMRLHKDNLILFHTLESSISRPRPKNEVIYDPYTELKSISIPLLNQVNFYAVTTKRSYFRSLSPSIFRPHTETKSVSIPTLKSSQFRSPTLTKSSSIQTQRPSDFRPPHKNKVNSDPYTEIKSSSIPHYEIKSI